MQFFRGYEDGGPKLQISYIFHMVFILYIFVFEDLEIKELIFLYRPTFLL